MRIEITTIPHETQVYNTVGNYFEDNDGKLSIVVSDTGNEDYNFLIAIHEMIESYLCKRDGINFAEITKFDEYFEEMRKAFPDLVGDMEPGDHDNAPYQKNHKIASMMEKWLADNMKIDYETYNKVVNKL